MKMETKRTTCEKCGGCLGQIETYEQYWSAKQKRYKPLWQNFAILDKVKDEEQRIWYIKKTIENGWSHSVLPIKLKADYMKDK